MTPELTILSSAAHLQCIQFALIAVPKNMRIRGTA
jgi:hypothetical protein